MGVTDISCGDAHNVALVAAGQFTAGVTTVQDNWGGHHTRTPTSLSLVRSPWLPSCLYLQHPRNLHHTVAIIWAYPIIFSFSTMPLSLVYKNTFPRSTCSLCYNGERVYIIRQTHGSGLKVSLLNGLLATSVGGLTGESSREVGSTCHL